MMEPPNNERLAHVFAWQNGVGKIVIAAHKDRERASLAKYHGRYSNKRYAVDLAFRLLSRLRCRVYAALRMRAKKAAKTRELVGCTIPELITHLERQFTEGMSWENYGKNETCWQIDHIKPCCAFDLLDPAEQRKCFHFSNLQPLWSKDNWFKSGKWTEPECPETDVSTGKPV